MDSPAKILIIDDDNELTCLLKDYFNEKGIEAYVFNEPPNLKKVIQDIRPDGVLLDLVFPNASGIDVLSEIKAIYAQLPVIVMTGFTDYQKNLQALRNGAYAFLEKPFPDLEELYNIANNAIRYHRELLRTRQLTEEIEEKLRIERLNLAELEFLKGLNRLIGETEDHSAVLRNSFSLLKSFLPFDVFAALIPQRDEINLHIYSNVSVDTDSTELISKTLLEKLSDLPKNGTAMKVMLNGGSDTTRAAAKHHVVTTLTSRNRVYGYTGLFRPSAFTNEDEMIFRRFCSHISSTLEKISLFQEIKSLSIHDNLTGIYNHMYVLQKLDEEVERSARYDSHFSIILFDIDNFKNVNDTYGHLAGDFVLGKVGEILSKGLRGIDVAGRYGGEEFLVILPETEAERAYLTADRLRIAIESTVFTYEKDEIHVTVSGGVSSYHDGPDTKTLIMIADKQLYAAKNDGKNKVCYDKP